VGMLLDSVKWDNKGLAVAIAQNVDTGAILMQGFANREALEKTISTRKATFFSRSRSSLWTKGETSMNFINMHDIFLDCDRDSVSIFCCVKLSVWFQPMAKLLAGRWVQMHPQK
jgi:phosphoribosyl-AMP cyclohydrolase / phosphoribosyl-ATP pyrophosphohydrolase